MTLPATAVSAVVWATCARPAMANRSAAVQMLYGSVPRYVFAVGADGTGAQAWLQIRGRGHFRYRGACGCVACGRGMGLAGFPHARQDLRGNRNPVHASALPRMR